MNVYYTAIRKYLSKSVSFCVETIDTTSIN